MFSPVQVILVCLFVAVNRWVGSSVQLLSYGAKVWCGMMVGICMGDMTTGLKIGATMELMGLGVGGFGGSSVPDYAIGTTMATVFACAGMGMENGLTLGITVALLGTQLDILYKTIGSFFIHKAMNEAEKMNWKGMATWIWLDEIPRVCLYVLPVLIAMTVGAGAIEGILNAIPTWFTNGMKVAGGLLPGVGFAILMKYLPVNKYGVFMIIGFVGVAYMNLPMLAIALLTFVAAYMVFTGLVEKAKAPVAAVAGGMEDE